MSLILLISTLLRVVVLAWAVVLWRRVRDWKPCCLLALMVLMGLRDFSQITHATNDSGIWSLNFTVDLGLLTNLGISLLMLVAVLLLDRDLKRNSESGLVRHQPVGTIAKRLTWTAVAIAVVAIAASAGVGWLAWDSSRQAVLRAVAHESLSLSRSISNHIEQSQQHANDPEEQRLQTLERLNQVWSGIEPPYKGSYLCVIEPPGRLALHSKNQKMVGTDVSHVIVDPSSENPRTVSQLLASRTHLATMNTNFRGLQQLAGYSYMPAIDSLVVVHVPAKLVNDDIRNASIPWAVGLAVIAGVLIPVSVTLLHHGYMTAQDTAQAATSALGESEDRFRTLCSHVPVGIFMTDADGNCIYVNEYYEKQIGITLEEASGSGWIERVHPDDRDRVATEWHDAIRGGVTSRSEYRFRRNDGSEVWVFGSASTLHDDQQNVTGYVGSFLDITEHRLAAEALRESESRFRGLSESIPVSVAISQNGRRVYANRGSEKLTGYSREELLGKSNGELADTNSRDGLRQKIDDCLENGIPARDELRITRKDGQVRWVDFSATRIEYNGQAAILAASVDITDRKHAEHALRQSEAQYRDFVENSGQGIYLCEFDEPMPIDLPEDEQIPILSAGCRFVLCNDVFARMYGFESGREMFGMRAIDLYQTHENQINVEFMHSMIRNDYRVVNQISEEFDRSGQRLVFENSCRGVVEDGFLLRVWGTQLDVTSRVFAERAVQESESRFKSLVTAAPVCIHEVDLDCRLLSMNQAGLDMMGVEQESGIVGLSYLSAVCESDRERISSLFERASAGEASHFEFTSSDATGSRSFRSSFMPILSLDGHVDRVMGVTEDITDRNRAERELRESEERYRRFVEHSREGIVMCEFDEPIAISLPEEEQVRRIHRGYCFVTCNDAFAMTYGFERAEDLIGKRQEDIDGRSSNQTPANLLGLRQMVRQGYRAAQVLTEEFDRAGNPLHISNSWVGVVKDGYLTGLWAIQQDVSEKVEAEKAIRESEGRYRSLVESLPQSIFRKDRSGRLTFANQRFCELTGRSWDELMGKTDIDLYSPETAARYQTDDRQVIVSGRALQKTEEVRGPNGEPQTVEVVKIPIRDASGEIVGVQGILHDITRRLKLEQQIEHDRNAMAQMNRLNSMGEMAAGIAHEVNQPLYTIVNFANAARNFLGDGSQPEVDSLRECHTAIAAQAARAGEIIKHMRSFVAPMAPLQVSIDVFQVIDEAVTFVTPEANRRGIHIEIDSGDTDSSVQADRIQIQQVLVNLLQNAFEADDESNPVQSRVLIRTDDVDGMIRVSVVDAGVGLTEDQSLSLFEPFVTTRSMGMGMGLAICRTIVESHGGTIRCYRNADRGSTFEFTLPLQSDGDDSDGSNSIRD